MTPTSVAADARLVDGTNLADVAEWCGGEAVLGVVVVPTIDGEVVVEPGGWVVRDQGGEFRAADRPSLPPPHPLPDRRWSA